MARQVERRKSEQTPCNLRDRRSCERRKSSVRTHVQSLRDADKSEQVGGE